MNTSIWSSLRNPTYLRLWLALVVSGCCVSAHEMAATWAMNSLGAPTLWLSLMSSAGTLPFFLFTLPAGALADLADRRRLLSALTAKQWSIDFSTETNLEPDPLPFNSPHFYLAAANDGSITAAIEIEVAPENQIRFFRLMKKIRLLFLRNGAFSARLGQDMDNPNRFRLQAMYSTWAAVARLDRRITRDEHALWSELWTLHIGPDSPSPKRHLGIQHWIPEESAMSRGPGFPWTWRKSNWENLQKWLREALETKAPWQ